MEPIAYSDVLMLHDLDAEEAVVDSTLKLFAGHVRAGRARALGVSNATVVDLERLRPIAVQAGAPITYVQNRASPYHRDDEVRQYCADKGIQYMAYGMMGSAQVGACAGVGDESEGLPTQYLLARHDPRLKAVAEERGISEGELPIGWAQQRGIAPVAFTSRQRAQHRHAAPGGLRADLRCAAEVGAVVRRERVDRGGRVGRRRSSACSSVSSARAASAEARARSAPACEASARSRSTAMVRT